MNMGSNRSQDMVCSPKKNFKTQHPLIVSPEAISAFDLDHTLLSANSSYLFCRYLCRKKILPFNCLLFTFGCSVLFRLGFLSIPELHQKAFNYLFKNKNVADVSQWALDFVNQYLDSLIYFPAIEKLKTAQEAGHLTVLLSSSPSFLVEPIAKKLNISLWESTEYAVDADRKFSSILKLLLGNNKASILNELKKEYQIPNHKTYAFSDSHSDLPFLIASGVAYGVNPDRKLRSICRQKNWPII